MRLVLDSDPRIQLVRSYGDGAIVIGEQRVVRPLIITPHRLLLDWEATSIADLTPPQLEVLLALEASIVLLGAGESQLFASPWVRECCRSRGVALECMTLGAACRTYNILAGEYRSVVAGLFP
jgi:uncharacterized protein